MAGYIGSKAAVTQVDGYTKTEADARYVEGDDTLYVDQANDRVVISGSDYQLKLDQGSNQPYYIRHASDNSLRMHLNGTGDRLTIDSAGRVTMPYQPSFRVRGGSSGWTSVGTNVNTTVTWNTTLHNIGSHFSSNVFTAPVAGRYIINQSMYARFNSGHGDNSNYWTSHFAVNGAIIETTSIVGYQNDGDHDNAYTASTILNLSASDYVSIIMRGNGVQADYYDAYCYFSGHLLG